MAPTFGVRELSWLPPKSANFPRILDTHYRVDKQSGSFPRTRNSGCANGVTAVVNNTVNGEDYRPVQLSKFVVSTCSVRELLRFSPKLANFSKIYNTHYLGSK